MKIINWIKRNIFRICPNCNHSLIQNNHGIDQNDFYIDYNGNLKHTGHCTYCKDCRIKELYRKAK